MRYYSEWDHYQICKRSEQMKVPSKLEFLGRTVEVCEILENCLIRKIMEDLAILIRKAGVLDQFPYH